MTATRLEQKNDGRRELQTTRIIFREAIKCLGGQLPYAWKELVALRKATGLSDEDDVQLMSTSV